MLFNSLEFLVFFPVVVLVYFLLPHKYRWFHLLAASCYFYAAFVPAYLVVIFTTIVVSYFAALSLQKNTGSKRQRIMLMAVVLNILLLCVFKYYYFFVADANKLFAHAGVGVSLPLVLLFPLGLSFQTFQVLSYLAEVNRGNYKAENHFGIFALSVIFFPKLTAGPIERPQGLLQQLHKKKSFDFDRVISGLKIMLWGFFKKLVIADRLALYVDEVYLQPAVVGSPSVWLAVLIFFPIQLYCDFSGYSSIAVGAARIFGYDLVDNFRRPFLSLTLSEFWNRWHISLSTWLRDYVYQPVVIFYREHGKWAVVIGLMITFFVSGIWHGAGWHFVVYGLFQGVIIAAEFLSGTKATKLAKSTFKKWRGRILTYSLWALSLVFFRSADLSQSFIILGKMFWQFDPSFLLPAAVPKLTYALSALAILFLFYFENNHLDRWVSKGVTIRREVVLTSSLIVILIAFGVYHNLSFIYFKF